MEVHKFKAQQHQHQHKEHSRAKPTTILDSLKTLNQKEVLLQLLTHTHTP